MKKSFIQYFNKTELRKYINYTFFNQHFEEQTKVKRINTLNSQVVIFTVVTPKGNLLFSSSQSEFKFQSCFVNKKGELESTFACSIYYDQTP